MNNGPSFGSRTNYIIDKNASALAKNNELLDECLSHAEKFFVVISQSLPSKRGSSLDDMVNQLPMP